MLGLPLGYKESKLRKSIIGHMKDFILELGKDFLFIDEEHRLTVGGKTFKVDLLFYHRLLQCMVAVELYSIPQASSARFSGNKPKICAVRQCRERGERPSPGEGFGLFLCAGVYPLTTSPIADFEVDGRTFELGGKKKGKKQIKLATEGYVVKDDIEYAYQNIIPLWMFGFVY